MKGLFNWLLTILTATFGVLLAIVFIGGITGMITDDDIRRMNAWLADPEWAPVGRFLFEVYVAPLARLTNRLRDTWVQDAAFVYAALGGIYWWFWKPRQKAARQLERLEEESSLVL